MRPIMFSRVYPKYHPKSGQPTWFVEKIWKSLWETTNFQGMGDYEANYQQYFPVGDLPEENIHFHLAKSHTIRAGNRWKIGDYFSPRVWAGTAYRSPQVPFAPPIKIEKKWQFIISKDGYRLNGNGSAGIITLDQLGKIATNDGLETDDLEQWFAPYGKNGEEECQIICWNSNIEY